jgi:transcriptional regulator
MIRDKRMEVWQGTLEIMVLQSLETAGAMHGYGLARRIEQTSGGRLTLNYGTLYPSLIKLEQEGYIAASWGESENRRKAKYYRLTRAGQRRLGQVTQAWRETAGLLDRFLIPEGS